MIQLSALLPTGAENARKSADFAALEGEFQRLLASGTADGELPDGKILPDTGEVLPQGLPGVEIAHLSGRMLVAALAAKPSEAQAGEPAENEPGAAGEIAEPAPVAVQPVTELASTAADTLAIVAASEQTGGSEGAEVFRPEALRPSPRLPADQPAIAASMPAKALKAVRDAAAAPEAIAPATATKLSAIPVSDPSITHDGERPADAPQTPRIAPGARSEPGHELKLRVSLDTQPDSERSPVAERRAPTATGSAPALTVPPVSAEAAAVVSGEAPAPRERAAPAAALNPAQPVRPQDLTVLVDRLVEARESARSTTAGLTVTHADFGRVSMHFTQDNGSLTVSLANNDPGFARAVNAAVAAEGGMNGEAQPQADRRGDGNAGGGARLMASEHGQGGERGHQPRGERHERGGPAASHSHRDATGADPARRGIFA